MYKTFTTALWAKGKPYNRPSGEEKRPPLVAGATTFPLQAGGDNKAPRINYFISGSKHSTGYSPTAQRGGKGTRFVGERSDLRIV